jgi:hypothetical protein
MHVAVNHDLKLQVFIYLIQVFNVSQGNTASASESLVFRTPSQKDWINFV